MSGGVRWAVAIGAAAMALLAAADPAAARLRWSGCNDVEAECAALRVPLDRTGATPGAVRLRVARYSPPSRRPTLLYLSGGPGGAGVQEFSDVLFEVGGLSKRFELVSYDQRGTGGSGLLRCRELERDARLRSTAAGEDCAGRLGARRAFYTTRDSVEDIEAVRQDARRREADAVRHLLRHEAGARLRARPPGPRRADRARLGARARRPRRVRARALPGDGADAGRAVPRALPRRDRRPGRRPRPAGRQAARRAAARRRPTAPAAPARRGKLTALALSDLMFDSDYNPAIRAGIPVGGARGARPRRPRPAAAPDRPAAVLSPAPARARVLGRPLRDGVRGDAAAVAAGHAVRQRAQRDRDRRRRAGRRAFFPFSYEEAGRRDRPLPALGGGVRRRAVTGGAYPAVPALVLQGGEDLRTPPAGSARVAAALRAQRVVVPGSGTPSSAGTRRAAASGGCSRSCAGGRPPRPARGCRPRCPRPACRRPRCASWRRRRRPGRARADGGGARRHARRPDLLALAGARLAAVGRGAARRALPAARRTIVLDGLQVVPGVRVSGSCRGAGARACGSPGARAARGRVRVSPSGMVRGRLGGRSVRGRLRAGPPRPVASGARSVAKTARFRHRTALSSVRRPT